MPHIRQQIREAVAAGLAALPTTSDRVFIGRTRPLKKGHAPSLLIYTRTETSSRAVRGVPPTLERVCTLHLEGRVETAEPPDDLLDQIAVEIEAGMAALVNHATGKFVNGLAFNIQMQSTETLVEAQGESHIGGIRIEYLVKYHAAEGAPSVAL